MNKLLRIGTRGSELALWQAHFVKDQLSANGIDAELVLIKSEGDNNVTTPLYELGVQGIFTKALDIALLNDDIDLAVHSLKDVPTQPAQGIRQAAVLKRASHKDILVYKGSRSQMEARMNDADKNSSDLRIATGSVRRRAQWLHRFPHHQMESLRGNVNTRLKKLAESNWNGAVFAAAGLERISLRPDNSIDLDWMLPAPAQGAIGVYCRENDGQAYRSVQLLHDQPTAVCCNMEREFLRALLGGCSTPISALATISGNSIIFKGNVCSPDGKQLFSIEKETGIKESSGVGKSAAEQLLQNEAVKNIIYSIRNGS